MSPRLTAAFVTMALLPACLTAAEAQSSRPPSRPGVQEQDSTPQPKLDKQFPLGASWQAISINGKPFSGERPSLLVDEQLRARGFSGCNTFSATAFPLREQAFAVGPVAVTRKDCDGATVASERAFLVALRGARKWDVVSGVLVLTGVAGELRFSRSL